MHRTEKDEKIEHIKQLFICISMEGGPFKLQGLDGKGKKEKLFVDLTLNNCDVAVRQNILLHFDAEYMLNPFIF